MGLLCAALAACSGRSVVGGPPDAAADASDAANAVIDASDAPDDAGPTRCTSDANCATAPEGAVCNLVTGLCVRCLPSRDTCASDSYCDPGMLTCVAGCRADEACRTADADGGVSALRCDERTHTCVQCVTDGHCPIGNLCRGNTCAPGCDSARPCPTDLTCCTSACVDTRSNVSSCGVCGAACAVPGAIAACTAGVCAIDRCNAGYGDCNLAIGDGCETNLQNDVAHCGACGATCPALENASPVCRMGACQVGVCASGFGNCDDNAANGCETDTRTAPDHCGACGTVCSAPANADATCAAGACGFACLAGFADCDADPANGCETDTRTTIEDCGACGSACAAGPNAMAACVAGACVVGACTAGFADCDGTASNGCEVDARINSMNCGRCGTVCAAGQLCTAGRCGLPCPAGQTRCGATCVVTANDPSNCGACTNACPMGQLCGDGSCRSTCGVGQTMCGRSCSTLATDPTNCGACGRVCAAGQSCVAGSCTLVCPTGQVACGAVCSDPQTDNTNCGVCGRICGLAQTCTLGVCTLTCPAGQTACAGMCTDVTRDPSNCGACGTVCPSGCFSGRCASVQDVEAAFENNCLLYTSGRVFCWGRRTGLLTNVNTSYLHFTTPQQVTDGIRRPLENVRQIALAQDRGCALGRDGSVRCWGAGYNLGPVAGLAGVAQIHARNGSNFFAVTMAGAVYTWDGIPRAATAPATAVAGVTSAAEVAGGVGFGCARRNDNSVVCWGTGTSGQLGNGGSATSAAPVTVTGLTDAAQITAGSAHACALRRGGTVVCWGLNAAGQLGDGGTTTRNVPVAVVGLTGVTQVRAGTTHTCAVLSDGSVRCWGANGYAQLGNGATAAAQPTPVAVAGLPLSRSVAAFEHHTCAVGRDDRVRCWGYNPWGEAGGGTEAQSTPVAVRGLANVTDLRGRITSASIYDSTFFKCALLASGAVSCWSTVTCPAASAGVLGNGANLPSIMPVAVTGLTTATQITVGGAFVCARKADGTVACWGANGVGQLGNGSTTASSVPVLVRTAAGTLGGVVEVHAGTNHACARRTDGTIWCWGYNFHGELGDGTMSNRSVAAPVTGLTATAQLQVGSNFACARLGDAMNRVMCWGRNIEYQLGDGSNTNRFRPGYVTAPTSTITAPVEQPGITALRCEETGCWARLTAGTAHRWGFSNIILSRVSVDPIGVINLPGYADQGFGVNCTLRTDMNLYCQGLNEFGQLGIGRTSYSEVATLVPGSYARIQAGIAPGVPCAIERTTGRVFCWGPTRSNYLANAGAAPGVDGITRAPAVITLP
jgi:alpha-tubulin suppressor-like RCC1 family protein